MPGLTHLPDLLAQISPRLVDGDWVFVSLPPAATLPAGLEALCTFREDEALTVICDRADAVAHALPFAATYRQITLDVHSSLAAVGFLAAISAALAAAGIPCNVVSAYFHDHLFVPSADADRAMIVLRGLARPPT